MAIKRRLSSYSGMRLDIPHVRSIESSISFDFDSVLRGVITGNDSPFLVRGFEIQIPDAAVSASSLQIEVADTVILHSTAGESGTIFTIPNGTPAEALNNTNSRVIGAFQNGVPNYISIELVRVTDVNSADETAAWSQAQQTESQRTVPIGVMMDYRYIITTSGFSTNLPLYVVGVTPTGAVEYIQNGRTNLFRLGKGGTAPDPYFSFGFGNLANNQDPLTPRREWINENPTVNPNPVTVVPGDDPAAFRYGDFSISNLKEWLDAIMTRFKEVTGSSYWYTDSALPGKSINTFDLWWDSVGSLMTGAGNLSYNLILDINELTSGALQTFFTDNTVLPGDSYVEGAVSGNKATLQAYNNTQLVINSLVKDSFIYDEILRNRRIWRPNLSIFELVDDVDVYAAKRVALLKRQSTAIISGPFQISAWSYTANVVTITTATPHGYEVGDYALVQNLDHTAIPAELNNLLPNGVHLVKEIVSSTQFKFTAQFTPLGTPTVNVLSSTSKDSSSYHPYLPRFSISLVEQIGADVWFTIPGHSFVTGNNMVVSGVTATTNAPNGRFLSITVDPDNRIKVTPAATPTGTLGLTVNSLIRYDSYSFLMSLTGSSPELYSLIDVVATAWDDANFSYILGPDSLPAQSAASGAIIVDGAVALSTVNNPVKIASITNNGSGILTIVTSTPHGRSTAAGPLTYTVYGDQSLSPYIRTYNGMSISYNSPTSFDLIPILPNGTVVTPPPSSYVNIGLSDATFDRSPNNPYPGPVQWDQDIYIKGIIGDRYFRIPQTAVATGTPLADKFNTNGFTGTFFLQDGEVAFVELERGKIASNGATYNTSGSSFIIGSTPPLDEGGSPLVAGDFVKFESDTEAGWLRIKGVFGVPILTNTFELIVDNGQPPTASQRPSSTGRLLYSKTTYDTVTVKPHWQVTPSPDTYWIAVRRDNGSAKSKVYLKALELEQGEKRSINDNEPGNLLVYTGANTEAATNPNYSVIDSSGNHGPSQILTVGINTEDIDAKTRQITFVEGPELGFEAEDKITFNYLGNPITYTVNYLLSSRTVVVKEDISNLSLGQDVTFIRDNYRIEDSDNLTLALRKTDREAARINTSLERPIYDESVYVQKMIMAGSGNIRSGSFIYQGTETQPTAVAWVLHGNVTVAEQIESFSKDMPGGHPSIGNNAILVHVYSGTWLHGSSINQNGTVTSRTINNAGNPEFISPELVGGINGVELVLPPNRRTEVKGSAIVVFPSNAIYKASLDERLAGEDLLLIANDSVRQAGVDYEETFGGPKAKIKILRSMPPKSRIRFRVLSSFGSALAKLSGNVTMQLAYDGGRIASTISGLPVDFRAGDATTGGTALAIRGSIDINGQGASPSDIVGGIFGPRFPSNQDQSFLIGKEDNKPKELWTGADYVKTHSGYTGSAWTRKTGSGMSIGSGAIVISSTLIPVLPGKNVRIAINATAKRMDALGVASFRIEGTFYNIGAGPIAAGSPDSHHFGGAGDGDQYAITFGVIGNDVVLVVFGTDGSTIQWVTGMDYQFIDSSL